MSMLYAEILVAIFLFFSGEFLFFYLEKDILIGFCRLLLRSVLSLVASVTVVLHAVDDPLGFIAAIVVMFVFFIISNKFLRPFVHERDGGMLLDLPFFDLKNNLFFSVLFVVCFYWMLAAFFIFGVYGR